VAANGFGTSTGAIESFRTSGSAATSTSAKFGNQQITLSTPSPRTCLAKTTTLAATLHSSAIPRSSRTKLRFVSAALYLDRGVRHTHRKTERLRNGRRKKLTVVVYTANAIARHVPVTLTPRVAGLRSGSHTLRVVISYREQVRRRGHTRTVTVTRTLSVRFRIC